MIFKAIAWLNGLWLLPIFATLIFFAQRRRVAQRRAFAQFAEVNAKSHRHSLKQACRIFILLLLCFALAQPAWNPTPKQLKRRGRDIVFIVDVSKSMLAEDLAPNRLTRAKIAIRDVLNRFQSHRVGLVAFAGSTVVKCPLTFDHNFMRLALDNLTPDSINRGGSLIGDAIRKALNEVFVDQESSRGQDIILISDGEDQESFPIEAAKQAAERNIRIISLGLGDDQQGHPIPLDTDSNAASRNGPRQYVKFQGQRVLSKLVPTTLRAIADASHQGRYLHVATGHIDLDEVYQKLIANQELKELDSKEVIDYQDKFQLFLLLALVLLALEGAIHER